MRLIPTIPLISIILGGDAKTSGLPGIVPCNLSQLRSLSLGLGTWKIPLEKTESVVYNAIKRGIRHIDCACDYGNEGEVGLGIARALQDGVCNRHDLWISSKLWNTYHAKEHVEPAIEKSLSIMQLEYFDLYLIHFPISLKFVPFEARYPPGWFYHSDRGVSRSTPKTIEVVSIPLHETWSAMERLVLDGKTRYIGVSNFNVQLLADLLSYCKIRPFANQIELHPYLAQPSLVHWCQSQYIEVIAYSPFGSPGYVELNMDLSMGRDVFKDEFIASLSKKYKKSPAQIILRWHIQRNTFPIFKTSSNERISENCDVFDFTLTFEEVHFAFLNVFQISRCS